MEQLMDLVKPPEWIFPITLYLADRKPEDRIAKQYMDAMLPVTIAAFLSPKCRLSILVLIIFCVATYFYSSHRGRLARTGLEIIVNCCLVTQGRAENAAHPWHENLDDHSEV